MKAATCAAMTATVLAVAVACGTGSDPHNAAPAQQARSAASGPAYQDATEDRQAVAVGRSAWVSVSVARLWQSPSAPWPVDRPALRAPVRFRTWLRAMTLSQRRALDLRSDTEALFGDRVVVVRLRPGWAKVVVPSQPSPKDPRGYPGWVPLRQLTSTSPRRTADLATVTARTAWLRTDDAAATRTVEISFGTDLPVLGRTGGYVRVATPRGVVRRLAARTVVVHGRNAPAFVPGAASLVRRAKTFLGLPYLWGGLSGFGLDCSGLTWLVHRVHGITTPRDALPQSQHGRAVSTRAPGDLLFYAHQGLVHHVSMYVGDGQIIHAPRTGQPVQIAAFSAAPLRGEYVGARRYLD
jgi:gamma-D-glutamyl-L-lysine dipeptidyl-peptidase